MFGGKADIEVRNGPKQDGTTDYGFFAIATCILLASDGILPTKFEQSAMRKHLVEFFEKLSFEPFPAAVTD